MESTKDFNKESEKETIQSGEGEESPFFSLIIKDLNDFYIRYDVSPHLF
jgi:hypothetical protein